MDLAKTGDNIEIQSAISLDVLLGLDKGRDDVTITCDPTNTDPFFAFTNSEFNVWLRLVFPLVRFQRLVLTACSLLSCPRWLVRAWASTTQSLSRSTARQQTRVSRSQCRGCVSLMARVRHPRIISPHGQIGASENIRETVLYYMMQRWRYHHTGNRHHVPFGGLLDCKWRRSAALLLRRLGHQHRDQHRRRTGCRHSDGWP
jgi:hypothetical protein